MNIFQIIFRQYLSEIRDRDVKRANTISVYHGTLDLNTTIEPIAALAEAIQNDNIALLERRSCPTTACLYPYSLPEKKIHEIRKVISQYIKLRFITH